MKIKSTYSILCKSEICKSLESREDLSAYGMMECLPLRTKLALGRYGFWPNWWKFALCGRVLPTGLKANFITLSGGSKICHMVFKGLMVCPCLLLCVLPSPPTISPTFPHLVWLCNWQRPRSQHVFHFFCSSPLHTPSPPPSVHHAVKEDFTAEQVEDMLDNPHTQLVSDEVGVVQNVYRGHYRPTSCSSESAAFAQCCVV